MEQTYEKITLENGVRILYEKLSYVRSVSVGVLVGTGSRFEKAAENGISHFIEHMLFKGTATRTAGELARLIDCAGGQLDAYTAKDITGIYGKAIDSNLDLLLEVLCDMFFNSAFAQEDIDAERGVILEEIGMYKDSPDDLCSERLYSRIYKGNPLARPILGSAATLKRMTTEGLKKYRSEHYLGGSIVVAVSGSFSEKHIEYLKERFAAAPSGCEREPAVPDYSPVITAKRMHTEQNHLCLAFPCPSYRAPERYSLQLMNNIFGGGMSSRLFQTLREKLGLCYSADSFTCLYNDVGVFGMATALSHDTEKEAIAAMLDEVKKLVDKGVTADELHRAREQVKSAVVMNYESTGFRMNRLSRCELVYGSVSSADDLIADYNAVTEEDILRIARQIFVPELLSLSAVGKVRAEEEYRELIAGYGF